MTELANTRGLDIVRMSWSQEHVHNFAAILALIYRVLSFSGQSDNSFKCKSCNCHLKLDDFCVCPARSEIHCYKGNKVFPCKRNIAKLAISPTKGKLFRSLQALWLNLGLLLMLLCFALQRTPYTAFKVYLVYLQG